MANPLSPMNEAQINMYSTPATAHRESKMDHFANKCATPSKQQNDESQIDWDDESSSPFMTEAAESRAASHDWRQATGNQAVGEISEINAIFEDPDLPEEAQPTPRTTFESNDDKENMQASNVQTPVKKITSPIKPRLTSGKPALSSPRPLSRSSQSSSQAGSRPSSRPVSRDEADTMAMPPPSTTKTSRMVSPRKMTSLAAETPLPKSRNSSFEKVDESEGQFDMSMTQDVDETSAAIDETNMDDTCFSNFSVIPEMTLFSKLGESNKKSPAKADNVMSPIEEATPRPSRKRRTPSRSPSPTPRHRLKTPATDKTNNSFLIDFTQQIERFTNPAHPPGRSQRSPTKSATEPNLLSYLNNQRTPAKKNSRMSTPAKSSSLINLLDFELPPAPTPRSVPSISIRELESMKSSYQSHISSLKATLTGREAEVESLKKAVADAERRVGESHEASRLEKSKREHAEHERAEWEKRGKEVEKVLNNVREEVFRSEAEREDLCTQAEDNKRRAEEAEARILDLDTQLASARAALPTADGVATGFDEGEVERLVQARLDAKIEAVSRELHSVYKKKHETKVATLKKSYEARSEKKLAELQHKVDVLNKQNEELLSTKDDTFSGVSQDSLESRRALEEHRATIDEQRAQLAGLSEQLDAVKSQQARLSKELEQERVEKGELVAAVDEMLMLQSTDSGPAAIEDFRKSIQRPAGLRPGGVSAFSSGPVESKIGRGRPATSGLARPSMGKSKMMSNIERMGGNGRHAE